MPIKFHPKIGQLLLCDFSQGFQKPEMIKPNRPVIVVSSDMPGRSGLVTIVALSTKEPDKIMPFHYRIPRQSMPMLGNFQEQDSWIKGDMVYTVGFHRLNLIKLGSRGANGKRQYYQRRLGREQMKAVYSCVLHGINLGKLAPYL